MTREPHIEHRLQAYLDDELNEADSTAVESHLDACGACRASLDELRELQTLLSSDAAPALGDSLWPDIAKQIAPRKPWWSTAFGLGTAGAAVAGIVVGVMLGTGTPASPSVASADQDLWTALGASVAVDRGLEMIDWSDADPNTTEVSP